VTVPFLLMYGGGNEGGAVEYLLHLMANIDREQFRPIFVSMGRDTLRPQVEGLGLEYQVARSPLQVARLARLKQARFLHTHGVRANFTGRLAGLIGKFPSVTTVHSAIRLDYPGAGMRITATLMDNLTLPLAKRVIAISHAIAADVRERGVRAERVRVVYNGIPPAPEVDRERVRAELGLEAGTKAIVSVARLHPVKGLDHLLEAAASLDRSLPAWQLYLIGDGPLREELERQARELKLTKKVRFLGHVEGARRLLPGFDLYVSASLMEGLGLSVMEAMAARLPVVATAVGGVKELVEDGRSGLLVPPGDASALADAIGRALADPPGSDQMAHAAQARYQQHFTVQQFARQTEGVYRELFS
jgi:glycosyltransferase involved in cell wall biosynthesis